MRAFEADVARRRRPNHVAFTYGDVFEHRRQRASELARVLGYRLP
jgi:L-fucose isomerase-like protein